MECDRCRDDFCADCVKIPEKASIYVQSAVICCCDDCYPAVKNLINEKHENVNNRSIKTLRKDLETTRETMKTMMIDLHKIIAGPFQGDIDEKIGVSTEINDVKVNPPKEIRIEVIKERKRGEGNRIKKTSLSTEQKKAGQMKSNDKKTRTKKSLQTVLSSSDV